MNINDLPIEKSELPMSEDFFQLPKSYIANISYELPIPSYLSLTNIPYLRILKEKPAEHYQSGKSMVFPCTFSICFHVPHVNSVRNCQAGYSTFRSLEQDEPDLQWMKTQVDSAVEKAWARDGWFSSQK